MKKIFRIISLLLIFLSFSPSVFAAINIVPNGGTGIGTLTGIPYGTGTAPFSTVSVGTGLSFSGGTLSANNTGTVTSITASSPLTGGVITTTGSIGCQTANGSQAGCLSSTDWNTFNNKGSGTVTSVSGTSNRITSTGGATPVIDISASYVGQSSITTLGTITTGVWNGTTIAIANGGTNATSQVTNGVNYFDGTRIKSLATFLFDGTNLGIGATPQSLLTVSRQTTIQTPISGSSAQFVGLDANPLRITLDTHNTGTSGTALMFRRSRGTSTSPSAVASGDTLGSLNTLGYGTTGYAAASTGLISFKALEAFSDTAMGTSVNIFTTPTSSITAAQSAVFTSTGLTLGVQGTLLGTLNLAGNTSGTISIVPQAAAGTYNFNLPTTAGSAGQALVSQGGGSTAMTWVTPVTGSGSANQISYWTGTNAQGGNAAWTVDTTNQTITFAPTARTTGSPSVFVITSPADTTLTASTTAPIINFNMSATRQFATGATTTQRGAVFQPQTESFVGASTVTNDSTVEITGFPIAGANATLTSSSALSISGAPKASATSALVNLSGTALASGSANGTYLGVNPAAFTGDFIRFQINGTNEFIFSNAGVLTAASNGVFNNTTVGGNFITAGSAAMVVRGNLAAGTAGYGTAFGSNVTQTFTSGTGGGSNIGGDGTAAQGFNYAPTSGTGIYDLAKITGIINQTSTATGVTKGLEIVPTITSAYAYTPFEIAAYTYNSLSTTTLAQYDAAKIGITTFAGASARTVTNGASLHIVGAPAAGGSVTFGNTYALQIDAGNATFGGNIIASGATSTIRLKSYTVATLPAGVQGDTAYVTDALAPTFLATIVGGGAVVTPVFYNGTNWVGY